MAGKRSAKGSDSGKQQTFNFNVGVKDNGASKTFKDITKEGEKAAKVTDKVTDSFENLQKLLKSGVKLTEEQIKLLQQYYKLAKDAEAVETQRANTKKTLAQTEAAQSAKNLTDKKAQIALENQAYKRQQDALKAIRDQKRAADKEEKARIKELQNAERDRIKALKQNLVDLKQQQKELQTTGYGAIVNSFTEGLPARLGTALSYKTIGLGLETIRDSIASIANLQQQFAAIYAITDTTAASMEKLRGTIMDVGTASIYSTEQLAQATITLGQAGLSAEQIVDALEAVNNLAVGTGTDLSMSVNVLTSSLAVWNKEASQAGHVADVLTTAANRTRADVGTMANAIQYAGAAASDLGVSFEEFASVASAVTNAGLKARSVVGTGFRSVLTELINPSAKLKKVFEQLGISLEDVDVRSRGLVNVLQTLKDAGLDASMAFQGFDRRAASFFIAATSQLDTVNKLRDAFLEEGAAQRAAEKQLDTFSGQFERLKNAMKKAFSEAFRPFLDLLTQLMKFIADFSSNYLGQLVIRLTALLTTFKALKSSVLGIIKAFKDLKAIKTAVTAATLAYSKAQAEEILLTNKANLQFLATVGALTKTTAATKGATTAVKIFGISLKSLLSTVGVGLLLFLPEIYGWLTKDEKALDEANTKIKESEDRIKSLESAYDELVQKQKLYKDDQDALIVRGKEINKQFELQGLLALRAGDSLRQYLASLNLVIAAEKERRVEELKNKRGALTKELEDYERKAKLAKQVGGGWSVLNARNAYMKENAPLAGLTAEQWQAKVRRLVEEEKYEELERLRQQTVDRTSKMKRNAFTDEAAWFEEAKSLPQKYITSQVELHRLNKEIKESETAVVESRQNIGKLADAVIELGDFGEKFKDKIKVALGAKGFDEAFDNLIKVREQLQKEYEKARSSYETELKNSKSEDQKKKFNSLIQQLDLEYNSLTDNLISKEKELLGKRVQKTMTAYQDWAKAVEHGETGRTPEEAAKKLEELKEDLKKAIEQQLEYEKTIIMADENRRIKGEKARIQRVLEGKEAVPQWFQKEYGGGREAYAQYLSPLTEMSADTKQKLADLERDAFARFTQLTSRAAAANRKNQSKIGSTYGDLLPYTAALYGGAESDKFEPLIKKYKEAELLGSGALGRGAIRYGQGLASDKNLTNFMDDTLGETALKGIDTFVSGFTDAVTEFANSSKKFKDALQDFARSSLQTIGNWIIQMSIKAAAMLALKAMFPEFFAASAATTAGTSAAATTVGQAAGGYVNGGIPNRDSVNTKLMPGEYVLKKSAVDYLGKNFLNSLNTNAAQTMSAVAGGVMVDDDSPASVVNVWVVSDEEEAGMGPNDVIATITKDIRNGGQTRQLIKSIVAGRK